MTTLTSAILLAFLAGNPGEGGWPAWRGDGTGIVREGGAPLRWSDTENVRWKTFVPGRGMSSPIVSGNRVFLTTAIEGAQRNAAKTAVWSWIGVLFAGLTVLLSIAGLRYLVGRNFVSSNSTNSNRSLPSALYLAAAAFASLLIASEMIMDVEGSFARTWIADSAARTWLLSGIVGCMGIITAAVFIRGSVFWRIAASVLLLSLITYFLFATPETIQYRHHFSRYFAWLIVVLGGLMGWLTLGPHPRRWIVVGLLGWTLVAGSVAIYNLVDDEGPALYVRFWVVAALACSIAVALIARHFWSQPERPDTVSSSLGITAFGLIISIVCLHFYGANFLLPEKGFHRSVLSFDAETGDLLWKSGYLTTELELLHIDNSYATPTPTTDGTNVYAYFGAGGAMCVDYDGNVKWTNRDLPLETRFGSASSPVVKDGLLYLVCDNDAQSYVTALNTETGKPSWRTERDSDDSYGAPMISRIGGIEQLVVAGGTLMAGYDMQTGAELWSTRYPVSEVIPSVVVADDTAYFAGGWGGPIVGAIRIESSDGVCRPTVAWETRRYAPVHASPLVVDNLLFTISDNGVAACRDRATGNKNWVKRLRGSGEFLTSPVMADGRVYFFNSAGEASIVRCSSEYELLISNALGDACYSSPAVSGDRMFIRSEQFLWCINEDELPSDSAQPRDSLTQH